MRFWTRSSLPMAAVWRAKGSHLAMWRFDQTKISHLADTEGAYLPFFSPDRRSLGYFTGNKPMKLPVDGGAPSVLSDSALGGGVSWGEVGEIAAGISRFENGIISGISAAGGTPRPITTLDFG